MVGIGVLAVALGSGCKEQDLTFRLKADGSCEVAIDLVMARSMLEQQISQMEMLGSHMDGEKEGDIWGEEEEPETTAVPAPEERRIEEDFAPADAEFAEKVRGLFSSANPMMRGRDRQELRRLVIAEDEVTLGIVSPYETLSDFLSSGQAVMQMGFESIRLEEGAEGELRLILRPSPMLAGDFSRVAQQLKMAEASVTMRFEMPGEVIESALPSSEGRATWIRIAHDDKRSIATARSTLGSEELVVRSRKGGLELELPLDSAELARSLRMPGRPSTPGSELPLTDAGPGFAAEATAVTTTTLHLFPEGKKLAEDGRYSHLQRGVGTVVQAKLFAPRGRGILGVERVRVVSAVDDRGRPLEAKEGGGGTNMLSMTRHLGGEEERAESTDISLEIELPRPDAEAIEEIRGEAVVTTFGTWKEATLESLAEDRSRRLSLERVVAGASITVHRIKLDRDEDGDVSGFVAVKVRGPAEAGSLSFKLNMPGTRYGNSYIQSEDVDREGEEVTRKVRLGFHFGSHGGPAAPGGLSLRVRLPDDLRRERVSFTLSAMDLF